MCSNYDKEKEPICALLSEKDEETIDALYKEFSPPTKRV